MWGGRRLSENYSSKCIYIDRPGRICHNLGTPSGSIGLKTRPRTKEQVRESSEKRG